MHGLHLLLSAVAPQIPIPDLMRRKAPDVRLLRPAAPHFEMPCLHSPVTAAPRQVFQLQIIDIGLRQGQLRTAAGQRPHGLLLALQCDRRKYQSY